MRVISGSARGSKLSSIESSSTRPTLDRVKESLFNIIQNDIQDSVVLDLFAGSGAIGIEFISRGAKKAYFCEHSHEATLFLKKNLEKTKFINKSEVFECDYNIALKALSSQMLKFDFIYIDAPYKDDIAAKAVAKVMEFDLLNQDGTIIIETDEKDRDIKELEQIQVTVNDLRKYGRAWLIFLNRKE